MKLIAIILAVCVSVAFAKHVSRKVSKKNLTGFWIGAGLGISFGALAALAVL